MKFLCALFVVCAIQAAYSQEVRSGQCPKVNAQNIVNSDFLGLWHGGFKINFAPTAGTKCNYACYKLSGNTLTVTNHFVNTTTGAASQIAPLVGSFTGPGRFEVNINGKKTNFYVLALNKIAASLWSCDNIDAKSYSENIFGLVKTIPPTSAAIDFAKSGFNNNKISLANTVANNQAGCPVAKC